jgi:hypothetical protein
MFSLFRNSDKLDGTFHSSVSQSEDPSTAWLVPSFHHGKSRLLKTGFFRAGKVREGAENTKEKIQAVLLC